MKKIAPPPRITVSEWADRERRLSSEASAEPGRWRTDRAPYQRGFMDAFNDPAVREIVGMIGAQTGKTEGILNVIGYLVDNDPCPILAVQPTLQMAEAFSKDRLSPMFRDTPAIRNKVKDGKSRDGASTILHKKFPGGHITLAGSNSPASLASRPIRVVLFDEVDRFPPSAGEEGDPVSLGKKRTTTFYNKKAAMVSTPTSKGNSRIEKAFEASDKRRYHLPCPHCGHMQHLVFSQFRWAEGKPETVYYECLGCKGHIDESHKAEMLRAGQWIAEKPFNGVAGFHLNAFYSPWAKWAELIAEFLEVKDDPLRLRTYVNTALAETWQEKGEVPDANRIYERREIYPIGTIPKGGLFLTAGVDVQKDRIEVEVVAWGRGKESWSVDYRVIPGDVTDQTEEGPWWKVSAMLSETWPRVDGARLPILCMAVDSGFETKQVYAWCRRFPMTRVIAVKGQESGAAPLGAPSKVDLNIEGTRIRRGFSVFPVAVNLLKSEIYARLRLNKPEDGRPYPPGYMHFPEYSLQYFEQLTAEHVVRRVLRGNYVKYQWEKLRERNEALDCRVYGAAAAIHVGIDRFEEAHWQKLEGEFQARPVLPHPPAPAAPQPAAPSTESADETSSPSTPPPRPPPPKKQRYRGSMI